jgi:hypothetical protein
VKKRIPKKDSFPEELLSGVSQIIEQAKPKDAIYLNRETTLI